MPDPTTTPAPEAPVTTPETTPAPEPTTPAPEDADDWKSKIPDADDFVPTKWNREPEEDEPEEPEEPEKEPEATEDPAPEPSPEEAKAMVSNHPGGYMGKMLRVDLTKGKVSE